ncbi:hypothetical protein SAMN02745121_09004 [Nannocystis exedens]|uniref:Uncharacterized protein n=1 Tax=Nannocystis exedens TaxID=54 RepID=A0A1I2IV36_9BACT|nr:hypothetical protein [Nannocystis exedens]PCC68150.1 hypothetical protein NAEX_01159 [Nannocystis exedens]SFF46079.1 hypothetical protein SAMN02745121_09004 [Nannocystis exedens]
MRQRQLGGILDRPGRHLRGAHVEQLGQRDDVDLDVELDQRGAEDSAAASSSGAASTFDMAPPPDLGDPTPAGCKGKIDFVFAISELGTMVTEQAQLIASLPGFMETIAADFADFDPHVISIHTDGKWRGQFCESPTWCLNLGNCGPNAIGYECGKYVDQVRTCDKTLGAGLIFNAGPYAYNKPCDLYGGNRDIIHDEHEHQERVGSEKAGVAALGPVDLR